MNSEGIANDHRRHMEDAIALAKSCTANAPGIPKVGAVIVVNGVVIGTGKRGSGNPNDEDHAEKVVGRDAGVAVLHAAIMKHQT
jgi:pyrimidine deaminase RibD-like protein